MTSPSDPTAPQCPPSPGDRPDKLLVIKVAIMVLSGVYILTFISILVFIKKLPFLADIIKNWVHFIKKITSEMEVAPRFNC